MQYQPTILEYLFPALLLVSHRDMSSGIFEENPGREVEQPILSQRIPTFARQAKKREPYIERRIPQR